MRIHYNCATSCSLIGWLPRIINGLSTREALRSIGPHAETGVFALSQNGDSGSMGMAPGYPVISKSEYCIPRTNFSEKARIKTWVWSAFIDIKKIPKENKSRRESKIDIIAYQCHMMEILYKITTLKLEKCSNRYWTTVFFYTLKFTACCVPVITQKGCRSYPSDFAHDFFALATTEMHFRFERVLRRLPPLHRISHIPVPLKKK